MKPIGTSIQSAVRPAGLQAAESTLAQDRASFRLKRVEILFACYRKDEAVNAEIYAAAAGAMLSDYPDQVVLAVTDPRTGLPSKSQWLPTIKEIKDACEAILTENAAALKRERQAQEQLAERKAIEAVREAKRTPEQQAKIDEQVADWERRKAAIIQEHNAARPKLDMDNSRWMLREYERAGKPPIYASDGTLISLETSQRLANSVLDRKAS